MTSAENEGTKSRIVIGDESQMICWMRRRRRRRKMAEKLPDVVVTEMIERLADVNVTERMNDSPPSYEDSQTTEARNIHGRDEIEGGCR